MYVKDHDLASLISSRICHDLVSPVGAIMNGLELMELSGVPQSPEYSLLARSVKDAKSKINFFSVAFGAAGPSTQLASDQIMQLLGDNYNESRISVRWDHTKTTDRPIVKLIFLFLLCSETCLPHGGTIVISCLDNRWHISGKGDPIVIKQDFWNRVLTESDVGELPASAVQFPLALQQLQTLGAQIDFQHSNTTFDIVLSKT